MKNKPPIQCCIPIELIQPWDQEEAIRQVKALDLGNAIIIQRHCHVGNSEEDRARWKKEFPSLAAQVDATPRFPDRPKHGMAAIFPLPVEFSLEQLRLCDELGLSVLCFIPPLLPLPPEDLARVSDLYRKLVQTEMFMFENTSILGVTIPTEHLKRLDITPITSQAQAASTQPGRKPAASIFDDPAKLDFQAVHDWFVDRFRKHGELVRASGGRRLDATEATVQLRLAMEAGADVPNLEMVPHEPLRGLASVRGTAKAYGKKLWGLHVAMGYYRSPSDRWLPERLRIAYDLGFAAGASIFTEPNMPLRNWGTCSAIFTIQGSPPMKEGEQECREFDDPICARARELLSGFHRFTRFHERPEHGPRVRMGFVLGHLDGWTGGENDRMWMVDHPGFLAPDALRTWRHFERTFDSEAWYVQPRKYYWAADPARPLWHGTPPCGQVDIVPIEAPAENLGQYGCLSFLGWNTMTAQNYARLVTYVKDGGILFINIPHFSTRKRGDAPQEFIHDGDLRELCGVRVSGRGESIEEVYLAEQSLMPSCVFPQGSLYLEEATLARIELHGARVLAHPRGKTDQPVLLEHRLGKGCVYLLATWEYPGTRLDACITDILRTLSASQQGDIAVEGRDVFYSVYDGHMPSGQPFSMVYLVNHDIYGQPAYPKLMVRDAQLPLRVSGRDLRIAWIFDNLVVAPHDPFVKVVDARLDAGGWDLTLSSAPIKPGCGADEERAIQIEAVRGAIRKIELDGFELVRERRADGDAAIRCRLPTRHVMRVGIS